MRSHDPLRRSGRGAGRVRAIVRLVVIAAVTVAVAVAVMWVFQRRLIYLPAQAIPPISSALPGAQEVSFDTEDGLTMAAWFLPSEAGAAGITVVVFNGNAGNRAGRVSLAAALAAHGYQVLLTDYRGYGGNPGLPTEIGLAADARGAIAYLESRDDVDPHRLVYYGESLGSAVAIELATTRPPAALVVRSPFTSLSDAASVHYPFLPTSWLLWDRYPSLDRIVDVETPLLVVAGTHDEIIPYSQSVRLYEAASDPKELLAIEGARHNDPALFHGQEMVSGVVAFLTRVVDGAGG